MKIENCGGKYGDRLILSLSRCNSSITPENLAAKVHSNACYWAPPKARSYTVKVLNTNYHGTPVEHQTGHFTLILNYFTTVKEGKRKVETPKG